MNLTSLIKKSSCKLTNKVAFIKDLVNGNFNEDLILKNQLLYRRISNNLSLDTPTLDMSTVKDMLDEMEGLQAFYKGSYKGSCHYPVYFCYYVYNLLCIEYLKGLLRTYNGITMDVTFKELFKDLMEIATYNTIDLESIVTKLEKLKETTREIKHVGLHKRPRYEKFFEIIKFYDGNPKMLNLLYKQTWFNLKDEECKHGELGLMVTMIFKTLNHVLYEEQ